MGWLWPILMACHGVSHTSLSGMSGVVLDAEGYPVKGLQVASIEAEGVTDAEGRFQVAYKSDAPYVRWAHLGVWYRRHYRPEDQGRQVHVDLPAPRRVEVACPADPMQFEFSWTLGAGFDAYVHVTCEPGERVRVEGAPKGAPSVVARGRNGEETEVTLKEQGSTWTISTPPAPVVLDVVAPESGEVACQARTRERVLPRLDAGRFTVEISEPTWVHVTCGGRPTVPVRVDPADGVRRVLWSPEGPGLAMSLPESEFGWLVAEEAGWTLPLRGGPENHIPLPALAKGTYRLMVASTPTLPAEALVAMAPELGPPGVCRIRGGDGVDVGRFRLDRTMSSGTIEVEGVP